MSLSDLASLGSFVSGFAVLVSLVFLYFQVRQVNAQVRQAERNQRAAAQQARATRSSELWAALGQPGVSEVFFRVQRGGEDVSAAELATYFSFCRALLYCWEDAYFQHEQELLDDAAFAATLAAMGGSAGMPGFRATWALALRESHEPGFQRFMDDLIRTTPVRPGAGRSNFLESWKTACRET